MSQSDEMKAEVRGEIRARLKEMSEGDRHAASAVAGAKLMNLEAFKQARYVMLYMPLASEIDVTAIALRCFQTNRSVCVPKVDWQRRDMIAVEVNSIDDRNMDTDEHGIRTPKECRPIPPSMIDLIVTPGLAFDARGHRLGRGGGFYDRFLVRVRNNTVRVGIAFDFQIIDEVPVGDLDASVDIIVTDRRVTHARPLRPA